MALISNQRLDIPIDKVGVQAVTGSVTVGKDPSGLTGGVEGELVHVKEEFYFISAALCAHRDYSP